MEAAHAQKCGDFLWSDSETKTSVGGRFFTPTFSIQRSSEYCMTVESERFLTVITSNCEISLSYYITVKSPVKNIKVRFCGGKQMFSPLNSNQLVSISGNNHANISIINPSIVYIQMSSHQRQTEWRVSVLVSEIPGGGIVSAWASI